MITLRKSLRWPVFTGAAALLAVGCPANDGTELSVEMGSAANTTNQALGVGAGFVLNAGDLRFIFRQIQIAQGHAGGGQLFGPGPNQVNDPRLPFGLRTVDGSFNHLVPGQTTWGAADQVFPRLTPPFNRPLYPPQGNVFDPQPRVITNLIADQTVNNPAAVSVTTAAGGICPDDPTTRFDPTCFIPNVAPDVGLSAPFNSMFTFFGQFFDHGLDLVTKGGDAVVVPLEPDDPLFVVGSTTNFMVLSRATNQPGPDGILGTPDDIHEATNTTTPFVDQNQTYTSHPSHQVFLREYDDDLTDPPLPTGRLIDGVGGHIGNWNEVKQQALTKLGIALVDSDVFNVPLILTDPYGHFKPGPNGFPQVALVGGGFAEGNLATPITTINAVKTGHGFLDDIAHRAVPRPGLLPDPDLVVTTGPQPPGTYDDELLGRHFITGDGRGNENIALTAVHTIFHSEHNRLAAEIGGANGINGGLIDTLLTPAEAAAWRTIDPASGWGYGERVFQAARFVTEMQYQHLVFEEFARKLVPSINLFIPDGINMSSKFNPAIVAEFAHATYRLGHSMLTDTISRERPDGTTYDIPLLDGFLNPLEFTSDGLGGTLNASQAAGAIFQGGTRQVGNQIDEFVTEAVRNNLLGLPLDLGVLNLARGRSEAIAPLNIVREQLFLVSNDFSLLPYANWTDFGVAMRNPASLVNFIAAYGIHPTLAAVPPCITGPAPTCGIEGRRAAAQDLLTDADFMNGPAADTGVDTIDLWIGGLAEKTSPFGSMLGPTFTYVFEHQLENLQNEDRFYYLERLDGLNLLSQLEGNSFQELVLRNTVSAGLAQDVFGRLDVVLNLAAIAGPGNTIVDDPSTAFNELDLVADGTLTRLADGTFRYSGLLHVLWNGDDAADERVISSEGDDNIAMNGGDDFVQSGPGNDLVTGGFGNDMLTDLFGDDVIKGGPGDDAISGGPGIDLLQGNEGNDFLLAGDDMTENFGGPGNDIIYMGAGLSESIGGAGDDWMEGTTSPASIAIADDNNQFQNDPNGGHDVGVAGPGDMDFDMEGGDDIMVVNDVPTHRCEGMLGFDWVTYRGETVPIIADMLVTGAVAVIAPLNEQRDRFDLVEGLSGTDFDDQLRGDNRVEANLRNDGLTGVVNGHVLTAAGIARIDNVAVLLPPGATEFAGGNILLGGLGSDTLEGRGGDDILDGDRWLNAQLRAPNPDTPDPLDFKFVNTMHDLKADVFAGRISPSDITIVRSIVSPAPNLGDVDTAVFSGPRADYDITPGPGFLIVAHVRGTAADGTDLLRNIEVLQFTDQVLNTPGGTIGVQLTSFPTTLSAGQRGTFEFTSSDPTAFFYCSMQPAAAAPVYFPCSSPWESDPLPAGTYKFMVKGVYAVGSPHEVYTLVTVTPNGSGSSSGGGGYASSGPQSCCPSDLGMLESYRFEIWRNGYTIQVPSLRGYVQEGDMVTAIFRMNTCCQDIELSLASYKAPNAGPGTETEQTLYHSQTGVYGGAYEYRMSVMVPNCYFQIDFAFGPVITNLANGSYGEKLIDAENGGTRYCVDMTPCPTSSSSSSYSSATSSYPTQSSSYPTQGSSYGTQASSYPVQASSYAQSSSMVYPASSYGTATSGPAPSSTMAPGDAGQEQEDEENEEEEEDENENENENEQEDVFPAMGCSDSAPGHNTPAIGLFMLALLGLRIRRRSN